MTKRNIDLLSNREMYVKYANVVEVARNSKISIKHYGNVNCVTYLGMSNRKHIFKILSATPNVKGVEKFVGIIHELSHILFQSPFNATKKLLEENWKLEGERYRLFFITFNILEDQRIESQMGKMYLKHASRFDKTTKKLGRFMDSVTLSDDNPANMLLGIRFQRGEDMKKLKDFDVYEKAIKDVVLTDKFGALRVLVSIKPYIDKWIDDKQKKLDELELKVRSTENNVIRNKMNGDTYKTQKTYDELIKQSSGESRDDEAPDDIKDVTMMNSDDVKEMIDNSKNKGINVVGDIFDLIKDDGAVKNPPRNIDFVNRMPELVTINYGISKGMSKIFKAIMMRNKEFIDYDGDEIDVESYVEGIIRGNDMGKCRINQKITHGVSIVISIDGSYSMSGNKINTARELVATMFQSVNGLDNIDIRANVWSGNVSGRVGITEINKQEDVKYIGLSIRNATYNTTPIHMALEHSGSMLKQMKGSKKLMIIITDGSPNHYNAGYHVTMSSYLKTCKKSLFKAMNVTRNIMCIVVQDNRSYANNPIKSLFNPSKIMNVNTMGEASERVIKRFKKMVMKNIV